MAGAYELRYRPEVVDSDLPGIPRNLQRRILRAIETRLATEPDRYGSRLRRSLWGLWKLRVGDYRVVYEIQKGGVLIWVIAHRKSVYEDLGRRSFVQETSAAYGARSPARPRARGPRRRPADR